jgi:two-component system phosphate regulon response regulator PhoB
VTSLSPATILIVDDDAAIRELIAETLSDAGYSVVQAPDGARALDILRASAEPLVVLLDLMMPRMSGKDVLQAVAADRRLATTHAYVLITAAEHSLPLPFVHLLTVLEVPILPKPFNLRALLYRVEHALRRLAPREVGGFIEYDEYEYDLTS